MSMKKTDLARQLSSKLEGKMKGSAVPSRFATGGSVDRREKRRADAAAGLVPFACKLPSDLAAQLRDKSVGREDGINGLVAELLAKALKD